MEEKYINDMAQRIYAQNKHVGWWDDPNRCLFECLQLVSTEIAEATEGARKNLMDDHLPHRKMEEVEMADALIRMLDLGGHLKLMYLFTPNVVEPHVVRSSIGRLHYVLNHCVIYMGQGLLANDSMTTVHGYWMFIDTIRSIGTIRHLDIRGAMEEKLEYNRHRADHKRENREQVNGKKF